MLEGFRAAELCAAWGVSNWTTPRLRALAAAAAARGAAVAATSPQVSLATPVEPVPPSAKRGFCRSALY